MTDDELIEIVQTKAPEDLSVAEIQGLRSRMLESAELRDAVANRLEMERYLAAALGKVDVSADAIMARAGRPAGLRGSGVLPILGGVLCLLLLGFVGLVLLLAVTQQPSANPLGPDQVADASGKEAAKPPVKPLGASDAPGAKPTPKAVKPEAGQPAKPAVADSTPPPSDKPPQVAAEKQPPKPVGPWDTAKLAEQAARGSDLLLDEADRTASAPTEADLKEWFAPAKDQRFAFKMSAVGTTKATRFDGVVRLRAPLQPGTALRLSLQEFSKLKIHFWAGSHGVTLCYYEHVNKAWVAYATKRGGADYKPSSFALLASDEDRFSRTNPNPPPTFDLRYEGGLLTLSRGDVRVLDVPLAEPPTETYFDGQATFRQIARVHAAALPPPTAPRPLVQELKPAELAWKGEFPTGAELKKHGDGAAELLVAKPEIKAQSTWAAFPLPRGGIHEIIVELDAVTAGTGVYLGDDEGKPRYAIAFHRDPEGRVLCYPGRPGFDKFDVPAMNITDAPAGFVLEKPVLRLLYGCGTLKCWIGADGVNWARAFDPINVHTGNFSHLGLYAVPGANARAIKLRRVTLRELPALNRLAPAALVRDALAPPQATEFAAWLEAVAAAQPPFADVEAWRRACALRTLASGPNDRLGAALVDQLVAAGLSEKQPVEERIRLLDEAAQLYQTWDDTQRAATVARRYEQLGKTLQQEGEARPYSLLAGAAITAPIWCRHDYNAVPEGLVRSELIDSLTGKQWDHVHDLWRRVKYWERGPRSEKGRPERLTLIDWGDSLAQRALGKQPGSGGPVAKGEWRHPLLTELSKEGYNVLAELETALAGKSYREACQIIITTAGGQGIVGLLPDWRDEDLLISLPGAVSLAMRENPELRSVMNEQFAALGRLRLKQAMTDGDVAAVEAATLQFFGADTAAEAQIWLGDRALSSGAFARAISRYREAEKSASPALAVRIAASRRLAAAMLGQDFGQPIAAAVEIGETRLSPAELEEMVEDMRRQHQSDSAGARERPTPEIPQLAPAPSGFETNVRSRLEGDVGEKPQEVPGELRQLGVDWVARQCAVATTAERMVVSNRFQVSSYDANSGQHQWRAGLGGEQALTHDWKLAPMRPLVVGSKIFVRRLKKEGPVLAALETSSGKLLWSTPPVRDKPVVSDPLVARGELLALCMNRVEQELTLTLCAFDPKTGAVLSERPVARYRDLPGQQRDCQATAVDDAIFATCAGSVLSCDSAGQVLWLRRRLWLPPSLDTFWLTQDQSPPLVAGGKVFILQPGVPGVTCLDAESGRAAWHAVMPDARRLVGLLGQRLIVETSAGLVALDRATGKTLWIHLADDLLSGQLCAEPAGLVFSKRERIKNEKLWRAKLVWVDAETGREKAHFPLEKLVHERPFLGPLVVSKDHLWAFFGQGEQEPTRQIFELTTKGEALEPAKDATLFGAEAR